MHVSKRHSIIPWLRGLPAHHQLLCMILVWAGRGHHSCSSGRNKVAVRCSLCSLGVDEWQWGWGPWFWQSAISWMYRDCLQPCTECCPAPGSPRPAIPLLVMSRSIPFPAIHNTCPAQGLTWLWLNVYKASFLQDSHSLAPSIQPPKRLILQHRS